MVNCINDEDVKLVLYADDTNIFIIGNDKNNLIQKGNQILKAVNEFMKSNLLYINLDKCYYMHFCPKAVKTKKDNFITEEHESSSLLDLDNSVNISGTSIPERPRDTLRGPVTPLLHGWVRIDEARDP